MVYECRNPVFSNEDGTVITLEYNHSEFGWLEFSASPDDVEPHGREIYAAALAGEYGDIEEYSNEIDIEYLEYSVREKRDSLLIELDRIVSNPLRWETFDDVMKVELSEYREELLNIPQQSGFPEEIEWPLNPLEK